MTKLVLVRLNYSDVYRFYKHENIIEDIRPPLGLLYVASAAESVGVEVFIIDAHANKLNFREAYEQILSESPDFVGITATTPEFHLAQQLAAMIKRDSDITVIIGGSHVSAVPLETSFNKDFDYIVIGEGEGAIREILVNRPKQKVICCSEIDNLDLNVLPARHLIDYNNYQYPVPGRGMLRMDAIESSRGCPFFCSFCSKTLRKRRPRSVELVVNEVEDSARRFETEFFMFFDDTFTIDRKFVFDFCNLIISRKLDYLTFYVNARANTIKDPSIFNLMKRAGITEISMGVESGNENILKRSKRGVSKDQYRRVYNWMFDAGLQTRGSFIIGHPFEREDTVWDTINFAKELPLMRASCNIMTPYPGTVVHEQAKINHGIYFTNNDWKEFTRWGNSVIRTDSLTSKDLERLQKTFLTEFYSQKEVLEYHFRQFINGNRSYFYYRPILFAIKNKIKELL